MYSTEQHRQVYQTEGYTILRGLIPPTLLADLRCQTDKAREIARKQHGAQAQRLQPVYTYHELDPKPFRDFLNLPRLQAIVEGVLDTEHHESDNMGVLFEPEESAWCTAWHRDWGYNAPHVDLEAFFDSISNLQMYNQLNGALYDDQSLWVVPGSHARRDTDDEQAAFEAIPPPPPKLHAGMGEAERERVCLDYVRSMPGAEPVSLFAGDVAFYRACQWHIGNYVPYTRRATLHDGFYGEEDRAWKESVRRRQEEAGTRR